MGHYWQIVVPNSCSPRECSIPLPFLEPSHFPLWGFALNLREIRVNNAVHFDTCLICCNVIIRGWKANIAWNYCYIAIMGPEVLWYSQGFANVLFQLKLLPMIEKKIRLQERDFSQVHSVVFLENRLPVGHSESHCWGEGMTLVDNVVMNLSGLWSRHLWTLCS